MYVGVTHIHIYVYVYVEQHLNCPASTSPCTCQALSQSRQLLPRLGSKALTLPKAYTLNPQT